MRSVRIQKWLVLPSITRSQPYKARGGYHQRGVARASSSMPDVGLVWYRRDLRLADHEPLTRACEECETVCPFAALHPSLLANKQHGSMPFPVPVMGPYRAKFLLESLQSLHTALLQLDSGLLFQISPPEATAKQILSRLSNHSSVKLYYNVDYGCGAEEEAEDVEQALQQAAQQADRLVAHFWTASMDHYEEEVKDCHAGIEFSVGRCWDRTLTHPQDLPSKWAAESPLLEHEVELASLDARLRNAPSVMTDFRKGIEAENAIRKPLQAPGKLPPLPDILQSLQQPIPDSMHHLEELISSSNGNSTEPSTSVDPGQKSGAECIEALTSILPQTDSGQGSMIPFQGGEEQAWARLEHLISSSSSRPLEHFKDTRMLATGLDNSCKLSLYFNLGCITPRQVHAALQEQESIEAGKETLLMHLRIRDFFQFSFLRQNPRELPKWETKPIPELADISPEERFRRWACSETGIPFIDASMRELASTGYMSNRSRQNVASILTKGMGIDWRWGEALFRCLLVDYDPASNVGNWRYVAGDDHDPRGSVRQFRTVSQGMKYDASANLITRWLPALEQQSVESKHQPWLSKEKEAFDYAEPLVDPISQLTRDDQASLQQ